MMRGWRILPGVIGVVLAGCVPWPHRYLTAPQISGTVTAAGQPVAGARVQLADVLDESGELAATTKTKEVVTDAQGRFVIGPIRRFAWTATVPVLGVTQKTVPWGLRLSTDQQSWRPGWRSDHSLFGHVMNQPIIAKCDVNAASKSSVIKGDSALVGNGPCDLNALDSNQ